MKLLLQIITPLMLALTTFFCFTAYFKYTVWKKTKSFTTSIIGKVNDIKIINDQLFFFVKWYLPKNVKAHDSIKCGENIGYYEHFIRKVPNFRDKEQADKYLNKYIEKHMGKTFILRARIENQIMMNLVPFENAGFGFFLYTVLSVLSLLAVAFIMQLIFSF